MKPGTHLGTAPHHRTTEIIRPTQPTESSQSPKSAEDVVATFEEFGSISGTLGSVAVASVKRPAAEESMTTNEADAEVTSRAEAREQFRTEVGEAARLLDAGHRPPWATRFVKNIANRFTTITHDGKKYNVANDVFGINDQPLVMNTAASRKVAEASTQMEAEEEKYEADVALVADRQQELDNEVVSKAQGQMGSTAKPLGRNE